MCRSVCYYYLVWHSGHSTVSRNQRNRNHYIVQALTLRLREKNHIITSLWETKHVTDTFSLTVISLELR